MSENSDILLPIHNYRHFEDDCIELLNSEWPRSRAARIRSLEKSCDDLPVSLLFFLQLDELSPSPTLVGHSCLCGIPGRAKDCWIQSVIVDRRLRGRGYGKRLMLATERYAKDKYRFENAYLSTPDKKEFYERLGYEICPPVINVGANGKLLDDEKFRKFTQSITESTSSLEIRIVPNFDQRNQKTNESSFKSPPPPPPILASRTPEPVVAFMKKRI